MSSPAISTPREVTLRAPLAAGWWPRLLAPWAAAGASRGTVTRADVWRVVVISGACGLLLGVQSGFQLPVETGQVLSGLVDYPRDNPFYLYHIKTWTFWHQLSALLLSLGMSERGASQFLGATVGLASFEALALCCLALCRNWLFAVCAPLICLGFTIYQEIGGTYSVSPLSDRQSKFFGSSATSLALAAWACYGVGLRRTGAFLAGISPALHPTLGAWTLGIAGLAMLCSWRSQWPHRREVLLWLGLGLASTGLSFAYHLVQIQDFPQISAELRDKYVSIFAQEWDRHRQPYPLDDAGCHFGLCALLLGLCWLRYGAKQVEPAQVVLVQCLTFSAALGLLLLAATHFVDYLPTLVVMAMPGRYINVVGLAFPALVLGLLAGSRQSGRLHLLLAGFLVYGLLREHRFETLVYVPGLRYMLVTASLVLSGSAWRLDPRAAADRWRHLWRWSSFALLLTLAAQSLPNWNIAALYLLGAGLVAWPTRPPAEAGQASDGRPGQSVQALGLVTLLVCLAAGLAALDLATKQECLAFGLLFVTTWLWERAAAGKALSGTSGAPSPAQGSANCNTANSTAAHSTALISSPAITRLAWGGAAATLLVWLAVVADRAQDRYDAFRDYRDDPVMAHMEQGRGLLLTGPELRGVQLRTRRPVMLAALNQLPYVPESGPEMNRILTHIYGQDLFAPRPAWWKRAQGGVGPMLRRASKHLWENRTADDWAALAGEFGFTQILVAADWKLQLPRVAGDKAQTLYDVPRADHLSSSAPLQQAAPPQARLTAQAPGH